MKGVSGMGLSTQRQRQPHCASSVSSVCVCPVVRPHKVKACAVDALLSRDALQESEGNSC
jgi:hypothetical protein